MSALAADGLKASNVFLDAEVFVEANFAYSSPRLASVVGLARRGRVQVFLTEVTVREIQAQIREAVERAPFRPEPILRNCGLSEVRALLTPLPTDKIEADLVGQLDSFIEEAAITVLPVEGESLGPVLDLYFGRKPPFGRGKKKAEFPDALVLETLREWCRTEEQVMAVVSRDTGVKDACSGDGPLFHFEDLPAYLDTVSSEDGTLADFIRETIESHDATVFGMARDAFPQLGFYLTDQDGDVEGVELSRIDYDGDVEIVSLAADEAIVEMPAVLTFTANVSYSEPGTGTYDSEDRVVYFPDTAEATVVRTVRRRVAVQVNFEGLDPKSFGVDAVWFEGKADIGVRSDYQEDWPYK